MREPEEVKVISVERYNELIEAERRLKELERKSLLKMKTLTGFPTGMNRG